MNNAQHSFYLIRHALSEHNLAKKHWKKDHNVPHYKDAPDYAQLKFNLELVDPRILPHASHDIEQAKQTVDLTQTQLVLCSPMRRCLQTCTMLLKGHSQQLKVLVEPLLSSRLNSAWSVGSSIRELRDEFPHFDFSAFAGIEDTWMMKLLEKTRKIDSKDSEENAHRSKHFMLETLSKGKGESYNEFRKRVTDLKARMNALLKEHCPGNQNMLNIVIVSHSCVLNFLIAQEFTEEGKVKVKDNFQHCIPRKYTSGQFLHNLEEESQKAKL